MANIIIPPDRVKIDAKDPKSNPDYEFCKRSAARSAKKLKFANRGEEDQYNKAVAANPNNIYGLPAFYPPLQIAPSHGFGEGKPAEILPCGHPWCRVKVNDRFKLIYSCRQGHEYYKKPLWGGPQGETVWSALS